MYKYVVIALFETMLESTVGDQNICIKGFSKEILLTISQAIIKLMVSACTF